jgi:hypothetical protein
MKRQPRVYRCPKCNTSRTYYCRPEGVWCNRHLTRRGNLYVTMRPAKELVG